MLRLAFAVSLIFAALQVQAAPARALSLDDFVAKGRQVVAIAREHGLPDAEKVFADPKNGFLDLDGPGLHVWATDAHGVVVFDLSGQAAPGTDIDRWTNESGVVLMDLIRGKIDSPEGTLIPRFKGIPHPRTNQFLDVTFWCAAVKDQAIVCAAYWPDAR
jgi:hypothetical protein